jgi:antitoxin component of MazEF toxin-antitoxin module
MPVTEKRKVMEVGTSIGMTLPRGWLDFFKVRPGDEVQLVIDTPVVVFPRGLTKEQKMDALEKIRKMIDLLPEQEK